MLSVIIKIQCVLKKAITIWPSYFGHLESAQEYLVTMVLLCFYENHCFEVYVFETLQLSFCTKLCIIKSCILEIQGKSILVQDSAKFKLWGFDCSKTKNSEWQMFCFKMKAARIIKSRSRGVLLSTSQIGPTVTQLKGKNATSHLERKIDYTSGA